MVANKLTRAQLLIYRNPRTIFYRDVWQFEAHQRFKCRLFLR
jgi:hypothetical protein